MRDGGHRCAVRIEAAGNTAVEGGINNIFVKDNNDGTFSCTYTVPVRGDYSVHCSVNERPINGSPFPVFFTGSAVPVAQVPLVVDPMAAGGMQGMGMGMPGMGMQMGMQMGMMGVPGMARAACFACSAARSAGLRR